MNEIDPTSIELEVRFLLTNDGNHPGERVQIEIEVMGDFLISLPGGEEKGDEEDEVDKAEESSPAPYPFPPEAPKWTRIATSPSPFESIRRSLEPYSGAFGGFSAQMRDHGTVVSPLSDYFPQFKPAEPRDRHKFYYRDGTKGNRVRLWRLECEEVRHRQNGDAFALRVVADRGEGEERSGAVKITVTAGISVNPLRGSSPLGYK